jgi:pyruvate/2-oxoglutarate dehydrogenase complex dihydrolipoamide acyltransferase (E2) component
VRGHRVTGWRRIAGALWRAPSDPQIFGALELEAAGVRAFIDRARDAGHRVTPTHLVGRAVGHALASVPEINVQIRGGRIIPRDSIEVFFITAVAAGHDLSGIKVSEIDRKPAIEVARELADRSGRLKSGSDPEFARTKRVMDRLPPRLLRVALRLGALVTEDLRREIPMLGLRRFPFGSAMVSSVGMLGLPQGFAPLAWMYDVPVLVLVGEITEKPVAVGGVVEVREILPITATIDHRYADGWHISKLMKAFREYLAAPERFEPPWSSPVSSQV